MASEYTEHYNLDLYTDTDKPNLRDQYNGAMNKIDSQLNTFSNNLVIVTDAANQAKDKANENATEIADEVTRAKAAEKTNADAIATEKSRAILAEGENADAIRDITANANHVFAKLKGGAYLDTTPTVVDSATLIPTSKAVYDANDVLAARFPIKPADIADGAITESKVSAELLNSLNSGISASDNLKVLYVGDSYGVPTSYNNQTPIPMAIQNITNWNVTNDSVGNRGYIAKGNGGDNRNFQETINSYSGEYDLIIIAGGRNDSGSTTNNSSSEYAAALKCFNAAHTKFPNAKIIAVPMLWHDAGLNSSASNAYVGIVSAAKSAIGTYCVEGAQSWGLSFTNWQEGGIHPDTEIAESYARRIVNAICTNFDGWVSYNEHLSSGSDYDLYFAYSHGVYTLNGSEHGTYKITAPTIPHWFNPKVGNNFAASVLTDGSYCAVFINGNMISVFGTPDADALITWSSSPFGSAD